MKDRVFIDTNVLIYLYSEDEPDKREKSREIFDKYFCITSTQVLNELSNVFIKKFKLTTLDISNAIDEVCTNCIIVEIGVDTIKTALQVFDKYGYSYYDSLIISSSMENECELLISEDMQD